MPSLSIISLPWHSRRWVGGLRSKEKKNGNFCLFFDSFIHVSIISVLCTLLHPLLPLPPNSSISFSPFPLECFVTHRVQLVQALVKCLLASLTCSGAGNHICRELWYVLYMSCKGQHVTALSSPSAQWSVCSLLHDVPDPWGGCENSLRQPFCNPPCLGPVSTWTH